MLECPRCFGRMKIVAAIHSSEAIRKILICLGSAIDFLEDIKCACAREGIQFDDDIFNELIG